MSGPQANSMDDHFRCNRHSGRVGLWLRSHRPDDQVKSSTVMVKRDIQSVLAEVVRGDPQS